MSINYDDVARLIYAKSIWVIVDMTQDIARQQNALAAIGGALIIAQMAEKVIRLCMQYVLQEGDAGLNYEKLKNLESDEAKKTLGYFLAQLHQRADLDSEFDDQLKQFLSKRNQLAHDLSSVPGLGFNSSEGLKIAMEWAGDFAGLASHILNVFLGLARAWSEQIGMQDAFAENEFFQAIDIKFKPMADKIFSKKAP